MHVLLSEMIVGGRLIVLIDDKIREDRELSVYSSERRHDKKKEKRNGRHSWNVTAFYV